MPLFVSYRQLRGRKTMPQNRAPWALDSGGFTELHTNGRWTITPDTYAEEVAGWGMEWAAQQDWMCEPFMLARTGLTVREHQDRTVANYLHLQELAPGVRWLPVLQGWEWRDYHRCADLFEQSGVDLASLPLVGVGSVCRRQSAPEIGGIMRSLTGRGYRLHGFGVKMDGLRLYGEHMASADSMAWSSNARAEWRKMGQRAPGCVHRGSCANCSRYALWWRERVLEAIGEAGRRDAWLPLWTHDERMAG